MKTLKHQPWQVLAVTVLSGILLVACGQGEVVEPDAVELDHLTVQTTPFISMAPLYIAEQEGYFTEQNLEIEFITFDPSSTALPALAAGELDVMAAGLSTALVNAILRDQNIRIVADRSNADPEGCTYSGLVVSREALESGEIVDPSDLAGRPVRATAIGPAGFLLDEVLKPYGLTMADLEIINLPVPSVGAALADGSIAAASIAEPNITQYVQQGHSVLWYKAEEVTPSAVTGVLVFGPTILDDDREVGNRFMTAYLKGIRQYNEGKTERNLELIHSFTELDYETLEAMCFPSFSDDGRINFELGYATFQDWALAQGHIEGALTKDELIDESFVDFANQALEESAP